jgi:hypothetical protein
MAGKSSTGTIIICLGLAGFLASALIVYSCQGRNKVIAPENHTIASVGDVIALDDPRNPYFGQYTEGDYWTYEHAMDITRGFIRTPFEQSNFGKSDVNFMLGWVDDRGCLIPYLSYAAESHLICYNDQVNDFWKDKNVLYAFGSMDKELIERIHSAQLKAYAYLYPQIPTWLASSPPISAMLLPNGDVISKGLLGSYSAQENLLDTRIGSCCGGSEDLMWCLYNADGELQATSKDHLWIDLYVSLRTLPYNLNNCSVDIRRDGYHIFRATETREIIVVLDYDGADMHLKTEPPYRSALQFSFIGAKTLQDLRKAQDLAK